MFKALLPFRVSPAMGSPKARLLLLVGVAILCLGLFLTWGANGMWSFVLPFRAAKLLAMVLVAYCVAVSSVLFQTITHNRILTPAIMGFDALYVLIQALFVFFLGTAHNFAWDPALKFLLEVVVMTAFSATLFQWVFKRTQHSLYQLMLVGIVFGLLFRSLSSLVIRRIDPNEFLVLQDRLFASFNVMQTQLLTPSIVVVGLVSVIAWRFRHRYDVLALGRDTAMSLGIPYTQTLVWILFLIAVLVSVSTALVGPITFLGLLASHLAYQIMRTDQHRYTLAAAVLLAICFVVGGQTVLERLLGLSTPVSVVIEFIGGLLFIALVIRRLTQ